MSEAGASLGTESAVGGGPGPPVGYLELVRKNRNVRLLWVATAVSLFGDWFNTIAVFALVERLTGSPFAMGLVIGIKLVGSALAAIPAGVLADRLSRRGLMIGSDLLRAIVVLGFLWVDDADDVPLLYALLVAQIGLGAVFDPAFRAALPNVTEPRELVTANALLAATWSSLLALGAAVGGFATAWLGFEAVFVLDAATYLLSAWCVARTAIPLVARRSVAGGAKLREAIRDVGRGWRYVLARPEVRRIAVAKSSWAMGGGGLVYLLTQLGEVLQGDVAVGIGVLYSARGLGTGLGPILARAWFRDRARWPGLLGAVVLVGGLVYVVVGLVAPGWGIFALIVCAHACSGANWVMSTVMLQERVEDAYRGRVFAAEMLMLNAVAATSTMVAASLLEAGVIDLATGFLGFAGVIVVVGLTWLALVPRAEAREVARAPRS